MHNRIRFRFSRRFLIPLMAGLLLSVAACLPAQTEKNPLNPTSPLGLLFFSGTFGLGNYLTGCTTANQSVPSLPYADASSQSLPGFMSTYRYRILVPAYRTLHYTVSATSGGAIDYNISIYDGRCNYMSGSNSTSSSYSGTLTATEYAFYTIEFRNSSVSGLQIMLTAN